MSKLTTHILDTAHGRPASGVAIRLYDLSGALLKSTVTNADGRCDTPILEGNDFKTGIYKLEFDIGDYYRGHGVSLPEPAFLDTVVLQFGIAGASAHYHVPLLASPFGYSTYRGS